MSFMGPKSASRGSLTSLLHLPLDTVFTSDEILVRHVDQLGDFTDQMIFVLVDDAVGMGHAPHVFNQFYLLLRTEGAIDLRGKLKEVGGAVGFLLGKRDQLASLRITQRELLADRGQHLLTLLLRHVVI